MEKKLPLRYAVYDTAIGDVTLIANEKRLVGMLFGSKDPSGAINEENTALYDGIIELNQYCYGQRRYFDLKFEPIKDQNVAKIYEIVKAIPYGETRYVEEVAKESGKSIEEVADALFDNPLPIFVPCHRVLASTEDVGHLAGCDSKMYETGEDKELKKKLIEFEKTNKNGRFIAEK